MNIVNLFREVLLESGLSGTGRDFSETAVRLLQNLKLKAPRGTLLEQWRMGTPAVGTNVFGRINSGPWMHLECIQAPQSAKKPTFVWRCKITNEEYNHEKLTSFAEMPMMEQIQANGVVW